MPKMRHGLFLFVLPLVACDALPTSTVPDPDTGPLACELQPDLVQWLDERPDWPDCPFDRWCGLEEYLALPDLEPATRLDTSDEDLDIELGHIWDGDVPFGPRLAPKELEPLIRDSTRLSVLLNGFDDRILRVATLHDDNDYSFRGEWEGPVPDMPYRQLLVTDPLVGTLEVVVYRPPLDQGPGPFPVVVVAHGHGDDAWTHVARGRFGEAFTQAGYMLVIPTFRNSEGDFPETAMTRGLLKAGWSSMAVRMYETLLARRVAAGLPEADPCAPVGLIGHSGGSISSMLTARLRVPGLRFASYINDLTSTYINWDPDPEYGYTLDETSPTLWPYQESLNEFETLPMPWLSVGYGYPEGMDVLLDHFDDTLL